MQSQSESPEHYYRVLYTYILFYNIHIPTYIRYFCYVREILSRGTWIFVTRAKTKQTFQILRLKEIITEKNSLNLNFD